jgi:phosphopantothenoylcysteine decarboxylase/phosphopantothenate--cysteine ligase
MAKILITTGPTRQYLDPVRFISNASSGKMGAALIAAALERGHETIVVSGPVHVDYPTPTKLIWVTTTEEMLAACEENFPQCDGLIGAAAPCDYRAQQVAHHKIRKTGEPLQITLVETPDIVASLGRRKRANQWTVGFALETEDAHFRAITKLQQKSCDLVVLNGPQAIESDRNSIQIINPSGQVIVASEGPKTQLAEEIIRVIERQLLKGDGN